MYFYRKAAQTAASGCTLRSLHKGPQQSFGEGLPVRAGTYRLLFRCGNEIRSDAEQSQVCYAEKTEFYSMSVMYIHKLTLLSIVCDWPEINMYHLQEVKYTN